MFTSIAGWLLLSTLPSSSFLTIVTPPTVSSVVFVTVHDTLGVTFGIRP